MGLFFTLILLIIGMEAIDSLPCTRGCPLGWEQWNGSCYILTVESLNWRDAGLKCEEMGGAMASPLSAEENNYMLSKSVEEDIRDRLWLNCNDLKTEGQWDCKNGGEFSNWWREKSEPDGGTNENCAVIIEGPPAAIWVDVRCSQLHLTLCKRRMQSSLKHWRLLLASRLTEHVVGHYPASSLTTCATMCDDDRSCSSFNFLRVKGETVCHLNNTTRSDDGRLFMKDNVCVYGEK